MTAERAATRVRSRGLAAEPASALPAGAVRRDREPSRGSWLACCNPTVKFAVLFVASIAVMVLFDPVPVLVLYAAALVAALASARVSPRTLAVGQLPFVAFAVGIVSVNALSRPGTELWPDLPVRITVEGVTIGLALALRAMFIGVLAISFLATTPPRDLLVSLMLHARLSPRYAHALLAGHRMLEAMPQRWATIRAAQSVRAPLRRNGRPRFGPVDAARAAFALLVAQVRASERIALALESRGLGDGPRTVWRPVPLGARDIVLVVVVVAALAVVLVASATGWLTIAALVEPSVFIHGGRRA
ncbi:hypothetical protein GCM10011490_01210 [Pseudoclavibacter endophyticus]|uniref:Energy-coupling factor transporter transmembrane protein EcfT n=1 Tax=Pseudoclavibacter endophyticus TaxID=1778590 RepID=A0A6H9WUH2_9MICO|nr:energy-coupling factor transporter transmembrane component T [Pseudoclavibacter endophyticus]KAB1650325.1 energy-coupling factor transporter transmembrane protein EcfT [Pseudoclavibacter endophyticus]GGA55141.1 hypothetical protein GCM10011490_01210 [Pseudoclavibacter endophyticus]